MTDTLEPEMVLEGGDPFHRQVIERIRRCILAGELQPGEQLPTVRAAAVDLSINPAVIRRAYAVLENEGLLSTEEGSGTFVASRARVRRATAARQDRLTRLWEGFQGRAAESGFTQDEIFRMVQASMQRRSES